MSATATALNPDREPPPVCLFENPYSLVSLWQMLVFYASAFTEALSMLTKLEASQHVMEALSSGQKDNRHFPGRLYEWKGTFDLAPLATKLREMNLVMSLRGLTEFQERVQNPISIEEAKAELHALSKRIRDELDTQSFLMIPPSKIGYYEGKQPLFGVDVFSRFPSANDDIAEAGKCLALGRSTACVFHLMRVMEAGLKAVAREMGIPYAPSWESYLKQINKQIEMDWKEKTPDWKSEEPFYKEVSGDLQAIKIAWRNPTMHIVRKYTEEASQNIFMAVKGFMERLALKQFSD